MEILLIIVIILLIANMALNLVKLKVQLPVKEEINARDCIVEQPKKVETSKEDKEKIEKTKKAFENLMGYGYEDAIKRK